MALAHTHRQTENFTKFKTFLQQCLGDVTLRPPHGLCDFLATLPSSIYIYIYIYIIRGRSPQCLGPPWRGSAALAVAIEYIYIYIYMYIYIYRDPISRIPY